LDECIEDIGLDQLAAKGDDKGFATKCVYIRSHLTEPPDKLRGSELWGFLSGDGFLF
jgi:hypothetical protein